ncbi:MAG: hypothetical protein RSC58_08400, partial [Ruthenibacterium sp.]
MEKQELTRKIVATAISMITLVVGLALAVFLLATTQALSPLIRWLTLACCVALAFAIVWFFRSKLAEIRALRLCVRDRITPDAPIKRVRGVKVARPAKAASSGVAPIQKTDAEPPAVQAQTSVEQEAALPTPSAAPHILTVQVPQPVVPAAPTAATEPAPMGAAEAVSEAVSTTTAKPLPVTEAAPTTATAAPVATQSTPASVLTALQAEQVAAAEFSALHRIALKNVATATAQTTPPVKPAAAAPVAAPVATAPVHASATAPVTSAPVASAPVLASATAPVASAPVLASATAPVDTPRPIQRTQSVPQPKPVVSSAPAPILWPSRGPSPKEQIAAEHAARAKAAAEAAEARLRAQQQAAAE